MSREWKKSDKKFRIFKVMHKTGLSLSWYCWYCWYSLLDLVGYKLKGIPTDEYFIFKSFVDIKKQELF